MRRSSPTFLIRLGFLLSVFGLVSGAFAQNGPFSESEGWGAAQPDGRVHILLLGDSTVIGSVPRKLQPEADHLEGILRKLLDGAGDLPPVRVTNEGLGGEHVRGLLDERYAKIVESQSEVDIVTVRYGLNDYGKREGFKDNFVGDLSELIGKLRNDFNDPLIYLETVIVYFDGSKSAEVNTLIRQASAKNGVPLIDMYARTAREIERGNTALTYHRVPLERIPQKFHALLPEPWQPGEICVLDNSLDPHLRDVPGWFDDKHPNLAGYHVIASELAQVLEPVIRAR